MKLIDADELLKPVGSYERVKYTYECGDVVTVEDIELMPTIDAEPVVRCKDCKYMTEHYDTDGNAPYWTCSEWDSGTDYDGYCHYGERMDEVNDEVN